MRQSPLSLRIALHYWMTDEPWHERSSPAAEIEAQFLDEGMLEVVAGKLRGTDALRVYVNGLCSVPHPVQRWIIPEDS